MTCEPAGAPAPESRSWPTGQPALVADRFLRLAGGLAIDAASGWPVELSLREGDPGEAAVTRGVLDAGWLNARVWFEARAATPRPLRRLADERCVAGVIELLDAAVLGRPRRCALASRSLAHRDACALVVAREARRRGLVPVGLEVLAARPDLPGVIGGRSVILLVWRPGRGDAVEAGLVTRAIVRLIAEGVRLAGVVYAGGDARDAPVIDLDGGAGPRAGEREPDEAATIWRVAEPRTAFDEAAGTALERTCDRRITRARRWLQSGRWVAADRALRAAVAVADGEGRRAPRAGQARTLLCAIHLDAGRPGHAVRLAREAVRSFDRLADPCDLASLTALLGHALIDLGEIHEAERVLTALGEAAPWLPLAERVAVLVALTRCRFWQGRVDEATQLVEHVSDPGSDPAVRPLRRWRARLALAAGDFALGGRLVAGLLNDVCDSGPREAAAVHREAARVRAATGDAESARGHYLAGLRCCRQGRLPAVAVRLRADWLESAAAMAQGRDVGRLVRQLSGVRARAAPLARARIEQALAVVGRGRPAWLREFARRSGFAGLTGDRQGGRVVVDELLELLSICHDESEQTPALERVCRLIKCRLDASSVCLYGEGEVGRLVRVGHRRGPSRALADQAMATGRLVPALRVCDGLEAAAPVRYGGSTIAALSCRWPIDSQVDPGRVEALLSTAAAACAPRVRAVIDVESSPAPAADDLGLAGVSRAIDLVRVAVRRAAAAPFPVLVEGESGSGKELVARAVHHASARRGRRWCALNCAAVTDDLVEAELFGHARGAFTGALTERAGLFEEADGGTLFLDEVGELSPRAQAKLLRAIQEGEVRRIGENLARRVDARIVAATNRPLEGEAAAGRFRADLRYRLEVLRIVVPPLRDRRDDIPVLAARFWAEAAARTGSRATLEPATVDRLTQYHWPGNVRELQNTMAALAVHAPRRGRVGPAWLPPAVRAASGRPEATLEEARRIFEAGFVREALALAGGRRTRAAKALGLSRQGLVKVMARLGIDTTTSPAAATTHVEVSTREPAPRQQTGGPAEPDRRAPRRSDP